MRILTATCILSCYGLACAADPDHSVHTDESVAGSVEISEDGLHSVPLDQPRVRRAQRVVTPFAGAADLADAPAYSGLFSQDVVPYGTEPDQTIALRRQIGSLKIADMNNDGFNDVIAGVFTSSSFPPYTEFQDMIFYGTGAGIESTPGWLSDDATHTGDVLIGHINNDEFLDLVTIHGGSRRTDNVRIYFGGPTGPSTSAGYVSATSPNAWGTAGVLVDIDNDGDLDLATTNQGLSPDPFRPAFLFRNNGSTLGSSPAWVSADSAVQNGIDAADINGDGFADLAVARWANFLSGIYLNDGTGTPNSMMDITVPPPGIGDSPTLDRNAILANLDNDPELEVFYNSSSDNGRLWDITTPFLTLSRTTTPPFDSAQETVAYDIDDDGDLDLAEIHFSDGRAHIYINRNGVLDATPSWTYDAPQVGNSVAIGDLNDDGLPDLALAYSGDISIRIFFAVVPPCTGDIADDFGSLGSDGQVSFGDFLALLGLIGPCSGGPGCDGDIADDFGTVGADGQVSFGDFLALLGLIGSCN